MRTPVLRLISPFNLTGIGTHARNVHQALTQPGVCNCTVEAISLYESEAIAAAAQQSTPDDVTVFFLLDDNAALPFQGTKAIWFAFETDEFAPDFVPTLNAVFDLIMTPSEWGRQVLLRKGLPYSKLRVCPEGVNPAIFFPTDNPRAADAPFRVLQVGKFEDRKSYEESVQAIALAFGGDAQVEYKVKCDWISGTRSFTPPSALELFHTLPIKTVLVEGMSSDEEMAHLYRSADVFLFPSKGEGWGLPLIEAIACGVPCITTNYSGQSQYLGDIEGLYYAADFELRKQAPDVRSTAPIVGAEGVPTHWAYPNVSSIAQCLAHVRQDVLMARQKAQQASDLVRERYSWRTSAQNLLKALGLR